MFIIIILINCILKLYIYIKLCIYFLLLLLFYFYIFKKNIFYIVTSSKYDVRELLPQSHEMNNGVMLSQDVVYIGEDWKKVIMKIGMIGRRNYFLLVWYCTFKMLLSCKSKIKLTLDGVFVWFRNDVQLS